MDVLKYFNEAVDGALVRFTLKESEKQDFLDSLPEDFCINYISKSELERQSTANGLSKRDFFEQFKIPEIPEYANVRSGDFGEMLCFILLKNKGRDRGVCLVGPRKWRWKNDKNKACQGSDVVMFHRQNHTPTDADGIEVVESKMKSTSSNSSPIQNAINGAIDDKVKRLAKTLNWIHERLATEGKPRLRKAINRYRFLDENPSYYKKFHAIAIIDDNLVQNEIAKEIIHEDEIEVSVISMKELKSIYEKTYSAMLNHLQ
jgi:hypothetical protein